jgi:tellurite resistance protein TehA-like permease
MVVPFEVDGVRALGTFFMLFNILLFVIVALCITLRFILFPETFKQSFLHPTESLFVPSAVVSFGTILINVSQYGIGKTGDWLNTVILVLFWLDLVLAIVASSGIYLIM